jgi:hypothetical protein
MLVVEFASKSGKQTSVADSFMRLIAGSVESAGRLVAVSCALSNRDYERVELNFANLELRSICESRRRAIHVLGAEAARELAQRLADISAFATAAEFADFFSDEIVDRSPQERALRLQAGRDLVFCAGHVEVPIAEDGSTDWTKVSRLRIIALEALRD